MAAFNNYMSASENIANNAFGGINRRSQQLTSGLRMYAAEHLDKQDDPNFHAECTLFDRPTYDSLLENWEEERLSPRSCNLRTAIIMRDGVYTGEAGLAQ